MGVQELRGTLDGCGRWQGERRVRGVVPLFCFCLIVLVLVGFCAASGATADPNRRATARAELERALCWVPVADSENMGRVLAAGLAAHEVLPGGLLAVLSQKDRRWLAEAGWPAAVIAGAGAVTPDLTVLRIPRGISEPTGIAALREDGRLLWEEGGFALARLDPIARRSLCDAGVELKGFHQEPRRAPSPAGLEERARISADSSPLVDALVAKVSAQWFLGRLRGLTGDVPIMVQGEPETLSTRYTYSPKAVTAGTYLAERMAALGYPVEMQWFNAMGAMVFNVVATRTGVEEPEEIYVLGAHYDSRSEVPMTLAPGANDNGSGTSVVLEGARVFARTATEATVKFVAFAAEEQGLLGSYEFVDRAVAAGDSIAGAIILDMVSYYTSSYRIQVEGGTPWEWLMNVMVDACATYTGLGTIKTYYSWGSDHVPFQEAGIPAFLAIEDEWDEDACYHRTCDTVARQDVDFGTDVARGAVGALGNLARVLPARSQVASLPVHPDGGLTLKASPNPFNPRTTLSFALPQPGPVKLVVHDARGREVAVLEEGFREGGLYSLVWEAAQTGSLSSGVYFVSLRLAGDQVVERVVLAR